MTDSQNLTFAHFSAADAEQILESVVAPIYAATHADVISSAFYDPDRFLQRVRGYMRSPGFELVTATAKAEPAGLALGYALTAGARWWQGLTTEVDPDAIAENGHRTFALCELMVHPKLQRLGIARAIHDELLRSRPEDRATLLVRDDNTAAQTAYAKWGWTKLGKLQPYPDSPNYDALLLPLRAGAI
ncbi:GNAT family N-acetyltransferase [Dactylosporangium sp. CS-047395]|uniref:GNAT family N-acetyltransferase n=1 Tax=Dactylosporangium sp. CS-047395 TaxID=3239936 RepID=UPI003D8B4226